MTIARPAAIMPADPHLVDLSAAQPIGTDLATLFLLQECNSEFDTTFGLHPDRRRMTTAAPDACAGYNLGGIIMFALPDIHPLLNFETLRCELKRCCRGSEDAMVASLDPLLERLSGPESQLFEEDARQVRVSLKWMRQRIHTFGKDHSVSRDDWSQLVAQVAQELQLLQHRSESIRAAISELAVHSRDPQSEDLQEETDVCDDTLCCR
ncbi:MAG: hypothetical protein ACI8P0_004595 [Planctomycetaceae bacterium]|jgi:hypothetical protein